MKLVDLVLMVVIAFALVFPLWQTERADPHCLAFFMARCSLASLAPGREAVDHGRLSDWAWRSAIALSIEPRSHPHSLRRLASGLIHTID